MKKIALTLGLTLALGGLAGCGGGKSAQAPASLSAKDGVLITGGQLVLPAVKGHPGAAYFTVANQSGSVATLTGVAVKGAQRAEMHVTTDGIMEAVPRLDIGSGQNVVFGPGGNHAMVFDLSPDLKAGETTEMTLTFSDGRKLTSAVQIERPGMGHMGGMAAMDHSQM